MNGYNAYVYGARPTFKITAVAKPSTTVVVADVAYLANHTGVRTNTPYTIGYKHNGTANFLFMDGHVANYQPHAAGKLIFNF
jgi:prepilin-type processing-associated H-X9-DG protein